MRSVRRSRDRTALPPDTSVTSSLVSCDRPGWPATLVVLRRAWSCGAVSQGTRDLNPQPSVLETDALPVELVPSGGTRRDSGPHPTATCTTWAWQSLGENHQSRESTGRAEGESNRPRQRRSGPPLRWVHDRGPLHQRPSREPTRPAGLRPDRRDRRVRDAQGGCQGQGAQGRGPTGDRVRRGRARLPDPRLHRRGRGRGLPRPEEPPLHPRRRAARAQEGDRGEDAARQRATTSSPARSWSPTAASRRSTRRSRRCSTPATR